MCLRTSEPTNARRDATRRAGKGGLPPRIVTTNLDRDLAAALEAAIARATGSAYTLEHAAPAAGGCIHASWILSSATTRFFAKVNEARFADSFTAEADGLAALGAAGMRVPRPIAQDVAGTHAFLVLEYLPLVAGTRQSYRKLGQALAHLHTSSGDRFGWHRHNYIGVTPQRNTRHDSWTDFWRHERLATQLALAQTNGYGGRIQSLGERLLAAVPQLLAGHAPQPSLLHGDLWSGNVGFLADGTPVIFDPAVYYGDAEADLAMTELFGGFPASFYEGYRALRPTDAGYAVRRGLYNLYHVLNHLNLFGAGYRAQAERTMEQLLAQSG